MSDGYQQDEKRKQNKNANSIRQGLTYFNLFVSCTGWIGVISWTGEISEIIIYYFMAFVLYRDIYHA